MNHIYRKYSYRLKKTVGRYLFTLLVRGGLIVRMLSMEDFAHHIIELSNENNFQITNLKLQKVMYFSLKSALKKEIFSNEFFNNLYDEKFLVWRYGPVEKNIYEKYRVFGSSPINTNYDMIDDFNPLNEIIIGLLEQDTFDLVNKSHEEKYWKEHEKEINGWRSNIQYSLKDVAE